MGHAHSHGDDTLGRIGKSQVRAWLADTRVAGASAATMQRRWSAARVFFRWAANEGLVSADPTATLNSVKVPKRLPATLGVDQARHILDEAVAQARHDESPHGARDAAILEVLYGGGLRVGELCGLDLGDVDRSRRTVKVTGKGDKERTVPMGAPALRASRFNCKQSISEMTPSSEARTSKVNLPFETDAAKPYQLWRQD